MLYLSEERVRAAEHATHDPFRVLERRHGLVEMVERRAGVHAEHALGFSQAALERLENTPQEKQMMTMIREDPRFAGLRAAVAARQLERKPTDRLSSVAEVLGVDALKHLESTAPPAAAKDGDGGEGSLFTCSVSV